MTKHLFDRVEYMLFVHTSRCFHTSRDYITFVNGLGAGIFHDL